jgi:N-methylhydantoinase B
MNEALKRIHMQVMWNRLIAVVEEQAQALLRTAFGAITREAGDLSAGVYDTGGRMLAQAVTGTPGHVNTMAAAVRHFLDRYPIATMRPGDVFVTNDPWLGTGHLFDYVMVTPVFRGERPVGLFASTCHPDVAAWASPPGALGLRGGPACRIMRLREQGDRREDLRDHHGELAQPDRGARRSTVADRLQRRGRARLADMMREFELDSIDEPGAPHPRHVA